MATERSNDLRESYGRVGHPSPLSRAVCRSVQMRQPWFDLSPSQYRSRHPWIPSHFSGPITLSFGLAKPIGLLKLGSVQSDSRDGMRRKRVRKPRFIARDSLILDPYVFRLLECVPLHQVGCGEKRYFNICMGPAVHLDPGWNVVRQIPVHNEDVNRVPVWKYARGDIQAGDFSGSPPGDWHAPQGHRPGRVLFRLI